MEEEIKQILDIYDRVVLLLYHKSSITQELLDKNISDNFGEGKVTVTRFIEDLEKLRHDIVEGIPKIINKEWSFTVTSGYVRLSELYDAILEGMRYHNPSCIDRI